MFQLRLVDNMANRIELVSLVGNYLLLMFFNIFKFYNGYTK